MMNQELFAEVVKEKIKDYLPERFQDFTVEMHTVNKVNMEKMGITLRDPNAGPGSATPSIYIDDMYEHYKNSDDLVDIMTKIFDRIKVLDETLKKYPDELYETERFGDYYIPETLKLAATFLEYRSAGVGESILQSTQTEIVKATNAMLSAINERIDEIYRFVAMETQAQAKALETVMGQEGYVVPDNKL